MASSLNVRRISVMVFHTPASSYTIGPFYRKRCYLERFFLSWTQQYPDPRPRTVRFYLPGAPCAWRIWARS
ncbi:hypothetical protein SXCC_00954 [Gluconacetobacter sp. SXCC-1]|nr:hypothetical protein SXCC_00954 [Gluconacetobacter sp. SXCC-1]